jgi:hypothetical protein
MRTALVIVAARNAGDWLAQCVESALAQALPPGWRVGVAVGIDACGPTLASASRFDTPRVATRFFPEHVGPYVIFNSLACSAAADVFVRFDADDLMLQGYLREQLLRLETLPPLSIVQTWSIYVDDALRPCTARLANGTHTRPDGLRSRPSDGQFAMTRAVFDRLGGFRPWLCHADSEFLQRARWSGVSFAVATSYLYLRRVHERSLTSARQTGYASSLRGRYAQQIADASRRYASGIPPEQIRPAVAPYVPVGKGR